MFWNVSFVLNIFLFFLFVIVKLVTRHNHRIYCFSLSFLILYIFCHNYFRCSFYISFYFFILVSFYWYFNVISYIEWNILIWYRFMYFFKQIIILNKLSILPKFWDWELQSIGSRTFFRFFFKGATDFII